MQFDFGEEFKALTGFDPFPWQRRLFAILLDGGDLHSSPLVCDIPTGLGKTAIIPIWYLAGQCLQKSGEPVPRRLMRLAFVVNRRTIVDQATIEAERLAGDDLVVSTMRGGLADNKQWRDDLSKRAVIVGTPDMVVSKLLFGGYGDSKYWRPIHAGILGNGTLFVVDEAHLSLPLCETLNAVRTSQSISSQINWFDVISTVYLSATSPISGCKKLTIEADDKQIQEVHKRVTASKRVVIHPPVARSTDAICNEIIGLAMRHHPDDKSRVLIYVYAPNYATKIYSKLSKHHPGRVALLTGTIRGYERDKLVSNQVVQCFTGAAEPEQTVYLISTSAGEVGWDIDSDHMICDVVPLDSLIQRLGRLNRRGDRSDSTVTIVYGEGDSEKSKGGLEQICASTFEIIKQWDGVSASPDFLRQYAIGFDDCKSPRTEPVELTEQIIDAWSFTSIQNRIPNKTPLQQLIHGLKDQNAETYVAWRTEVDTLCRLNLDPQAWFDNYPLATHELLRAKTRTIRLQLEILAKEHGTTHVVDYVDGSARLIRLSELLKEQQLAFHQIVLPTNVGGLDASGHFEVKSAIKNPNPELDVADLGNKPRARFIVDQYDGSFKARPLINAETELPSQATTPDLVKSLRDDLVKSLREQGWRIVVDLVETEPELAPRMLWGCVELAATDNKAKQPSIDQHNQDVASKQRELCEQLGLGAVSDEFLLAGRYHDLGKKARIWQRAIYNFTGQPIAKARRGMNVSALGNKTIGYYRHELGSVLLSDLGFDRLASYLVWSHHGHGRPSFKFGIDGTSYYPIWLNGDVDQSKIDGIDVIPNRFVELQHTYGHWALAYLHAVFCCGDAMVSRG